MRYTFATSILAVAVLSMVLSGCSGAPKTDQAQADQAATTTATNAAAPFSSSNTAATTSDRDKPAERTEKKKGLLGSLVPESVTIPAGTVVSVRLQNTVSSATASPGETFEAVLDQALVVNGQTVADKGAGVTGRVVEAKSSGRLHDSGYLRLTLASIEINGKSIPVQTSSLFAKGANHNKRNAALIGGGAGAGALIGGLAGGGKGALIGGLVGAGAGTGGAYATGKKDVAFAAERRLSFRLTQSITTKG